MSSQPGPGAYINALSRGYGAYQGISSGNLTPEQKAELLRRQTTLGLADFFSGGMASKTGDVLNRFPVGRSIMDQYWANQGGDFGDSKAYTAAQVVAGGPQGVGGIIGGYVGNKILDKAMGLGGSGTKWATEQNRLSDLFNKGYDIKGGVALTGGRSKDELIQEAQRTGGNVDFAKTRDEKSLTPQDIQGYASIYEKAGKGANDLDRYAWAKRALDAGAVREHHGTIDVDWSKVSADPITYEERQAMTQANAAYDQTSQQKQQEYAMSQIPDWMRNLLSTSQNSSAVTNYTPYNGLSYMMR